MEELLPKPVNHLDEHCYALQLKHDQLLEEIHVFSRKFTELSGTIIALEAKNAALEKSLSAEVLRNAALSSENEDLKQSVEKYLATQKTLIRDLVRTQDIKWYQKLLRR